MLKRIWRFFGNAKNREIVSWLGGGAVVLLGGIWTVVLFLHHPSDSKQAPPATPGVSSQGGIASGHDTIIHGPVQIGLNEQKTRERIGEAQKPLEAQLEKLAQQVAREKGVEVAPLRVILSKLGQSMVGDDEIARRFEEMADELLKLRREFARAGQSSQFASLSEKTQDLIGRGDLVGARSALAEGREAEQRERGLSPERDAELLAQEARLAALQLDYRVAAKKYGEAAALVAPKEQTQQPTSVMTKQQEYLLGQADALFNQGTEFGDTPALMQAERIFRAASVLMPREKQPLEWARTRRKVGDALFVLGRRTGETYQFREAIAFYEQALTVATHQEMPVLWAQMEINRALALGLIGERENSPAQLAEAVAVLRRDIESVDREREPGRWANFQCELAGALTRLGRHQDGTTSLEAAVATARATLAVATRERFAGIWVDAQEALGEALTTLGVRQDSTARLEEAVAALREALKERNRQRQPVRWARTRSSLGLALMRLAERERGTERLDEAVAIYRDNLTIFTRENMPVFWSNDQARLDKALQMLGERSGGATAKQ